MLPHERAHRTPHANATAGTLHGGAVVLVLGGHDTFLSPLADEAVDSFGDLADEQACSPHLSPPLPISPPHLTAHQVYTQRAKMCEEGKGFDWAMGEQPAWASSTNQLAGSSFVN